MDGLFEAPQSKIVLDWLSQNWRRPRVVVVGSGFTLNAARPQATAVPLWADLSRAVERDLKVPANKFDALRLPDVHAATFRSRDRLRGLLKAQLNDRVLRPGKAHDALWESDPAAVITTNFLDTVLEKSRPARARAVVRDADLGRPMEAQARHVVYMHGHRSDPRSWVAGQVEYEQLPSKRPMVNVKVRQLLAEFPALVVGYSLTDPDFHQIYGETQRSMGPSRPLGLALLPTRALGGTRGNTRAEDLNHRYWQTLGLSFVRFSVAASANLDDSYARFFKLTERITTLSQLLVALERPATRDDVASAFERNVEVGRAALADEDIANILEGADSRSRWWRDVVTRSIDKESRKRATEAATATNLARHAKANAGDGERKTRGAKDARESGGVDGATWVAGPAKWRRSAAVRELLDALEGGDDFTRCAEQLLSAGASRVLLREWICSGMTDPHFVPRVVHGSQIAAAAILTDGNPKALAEVYRIAQERAERKVTSAIARYLGRAPAARRRKNPSRAERHLALAFKAFADDDVKRASRLYQTAHDELLLADSGRKSSETAILLYFAAQGLFDCLPLDAPLPMIEEHQRRRDVLADEPSVRRWRARTKALGEGAIKAKAGSKEREGYERSGLSWSSSPGELWYHYERAKGLGAPPSIRRALLLPLVDTIPSAELELRERLALNIKDTGEWLETEFQAGAFTVNRAAPQRESPALTASTRGQASLAVSRQLFPPQERRSATALRSRVGILKEFPEVLRQLDVAKASRLVKEAFLRLESDGDLVRAWVEVAHVTTWQQSRRSFPGLLRALVKSHVFRRDVLWGKMLPWEHWLTCDPGFWKQGGARLARRLGTVKEPIAVSQGGWTLRLLLDIAPRKAMTALCAAWLNDADRNYERSDEMLAGASMLVALGEDAPRAQRLVRAIKKRPSLDVLSILTERSGRTPIQRWGRSRLAEWAGQRGWLGARPRRPLGHHDEVVEARCLAFVVRDSNGYREECIDRILKLATETWHVLPELWPILHPRYWGRRWPELVRCLQIGGHARVPKSWLLARVQLVSEALEDWGEVAEYLMKSPDLAFMRWAVTDGIAHGDSALANNAAYALARLARRATAPMDVQVLCSTLVAASNDARVGVAHGAAFSAGYIVGVAPWEALPTQLVQTARRVARRLAKDPLAVVRRQLMFGKAKGERHAREARAANGPTRALR